MRAGTLSLYAMGLNEEEQGLTGVAMIDSVEDAIARSVAEAGNP